MEGFVYSGWSTGADTAEEIIAEIKRSVVLHDDIDAALRVGTTRIQFISISVSPGMSVNPNPEWRE